jgi:hypothetical protein
MSDAPGWPRWLRLVLSAALATLLIAALACWGGVDWREVWSTLLRLPLGVFLAALAIHTAIYAARAQRFRLLMPPSERPGLAATMLVSSAHNLAVYVLPVKTGEATLPLYLKSACGTPVSTGLASLVVSRLLDLATLCGMLALATPKSSRLAEALHAAGDDGRVLRALPLSIAVWLGIFAFYAVLALGFGLPEHIGFVEASFGSSLAVLTNLLPVNALAGFGTQETGWVLGFHMLGVAPEISLPNSLGVHLVQLFDTVLFGVIGHIGMGALRRR